MRAGGDGFTRELVLKAKLGFVGQMAGCVVLAESLDLGGGLCAFV